MKTHPYLRAYMAGIALPTMFLVIGLIVFALNILIHHYAFPFERVLVFPMALVPNLWGLWNMLYVRLRGRHHISIGLFGAALPFVLTPLGYAIQKALGLMVWTPKLFAVGFPIGLLVYYLAWKYIVFFFNEVLGIGGE